MLDQKTEVPKPVQRLLPATAPPKSPRQQRLMLVALVLLLISLVVVLYRDREFWFPDSEEAENRPLSPPQAEDAPPPVTTPATAAVPRKSATHARAVRREDPQPVSNPVSDGPTITATRTVLPPLEVEVVAGDA